MTAHKKETSGTVKGTSAKKPAIQGGHDTDVVAESLKDGKATTDSGARVELTAPAVAHGAEFASEDADLGSFSEKEMETLAGELENGDEGYLPLDKDGNVLGPAKKGYPAEGEYGAPVWLSPRDGLLTPAGAPIQKRMNIDPNLNRVQDQNRVDVKEGDVAQSK